MGMAQSVALAALVGVGGWFIGHHVTADSVQVDVEGGAAGSPEERMAALERENKRLLADLKSRGPVLAGDPGVDHGGGAAHGGASSGGATAVDAEAKLEPLDELNITEIKNSKEFMDHVMRYLHTQLGKGREGHLALLKTLGELGTKEMEQHLKRIFEAEGPRAIRNIYPLLKFAVENDQDVAALTETFFEQAAENPEFFKGLDDDPFELFTEGIGMLMPAVSGEARMARLRAYAKAILEKPKDSLPKALERNRRDIQRLAAMWAPEMSVEDAIAKLKSGNVSSDELRMLLPLVPKEAWAAIDLVPLVGPMLAAQNWDALQILRRAPDLDGSTVSRFDAHMLGAMESGKRIRSWFWIQYLRTTKRDSFGDAKDLLERGLTMKREVADEFAQILMQWGDGVDLDWVRWIADRSEMSEGRKNQLEQHFKLGD